MTAMDAQTTMPADAGPGAQRPAGRACLAAALLVLAGCAAGPDFRRPAAPAVGSYAAGGMPTAAVAARHGSQTFHPGDAVPADWWRMFGSAEMDATVGQAIANNATLQSAQASLRQSQENLRAGHGVFYPSVDAGFSAVRQRASPLRLGVGGAGGLFNLFTLSATVSYALDVFGGERRTVEALAAQADYQRHAAFAAYLTLTGNVVNTLIARAGYQAQIRATETLVLRQKEQLAIAQAQASAGAVAYASVLGIASQLASSQAAIPPLRQKADQAAHLLASLSGKLPAEWQPATVEIETLVLPRDLPLSLPSELVRQRPDILEAEALLQLASANIGIAAAAMFPSFRLDGSYGRNSNTVGGLGAGDAAFWQLGPSASMPLFHGGSLLHRRQAAVEGYRKSLEDYRQAVLDAFAQVADVLTALGHDAQALQAQDEALESARRALELVQANFQAGLVNYLDVLTADTQFYRAQIGQLQALAQRYQDTTALFIALGGGWQSAPAHAVSGIEPKEGRE